MKRWLQITAGMGAAALVVSSLRAETAQEIAAGIVYARGGVARIRGIQTERMSGTILIGDQQGTFTREIKRPGKMRLEIVLNDKKTVETFNGTAGWKLDGIAGAGQARALSANETKRLSDEADLDGPFVDVAAKGTAMEVLGKEMLGPSLVWKLKVTLKSGESSLYYVESTGHYILLREDTSSGKDTTSTIYKNFHQVEGVLFPFTVISSSEDNGPAATLQFEKIEINVPVDDADFEQPSGLK